MVDALALALVPWSCFKSVVELALVSRSLGGPATQLAVGGSKKIADNPMDQDVGIRLKNLKRAPRCGARTRAGTACQRPAVRGRKRCRLHGGLSPGAPRGFRMKLQDWRLDNRRHRGAKMAAISPKVVCHITNGQR